MISIVIFNVSNLCFPYVIIVFALVIVPFILLKLIKIFRKKRKNISLEYAPNIDIGNIYSIDELNKYYEIKKLELFKFLINASKKNDEKINENYSHLINNYKNIIDYLKKSIDNKKANRYNYMLNDDENTDDKNTEENGDRLLIGDTSYNLALIPNYAIYSHFDLLHNI